MTTRGGVREYAEEFGRERDPHPPDRREVRPGGESAGRLLVAGLAALGVVCFA